MIFLPAVFWAAAAALPAAGFGASLADEPTLEEQAGALIWPVLDERRAADALSAAADGAIGGGLLRWGMPRVTAKRFIKELRAASKGALLIAVDHEGGAFFSQESLEAPVFSGNMALGAAGSPGLAEKAAGAAGRALRKIGVDVDFAPVVDVNSNPDNPVIGVRSFGEDPLRVAALGAAAVRGYLRGGILPVAKHFPGHGDTSKDSHSELPVVGHARARWAETDLPPFEAAIRAGAPMVMTAHIAAPALGTGDLPATFSTAALRGVLRGELGFDGVVVSDSLDMGAITRGFPPGEAAVRALAAGCDVLLTGRSDPRTTRDAIVRAVREGRLPREILEESFRRVRSLQERAGRMRPGRRIDAGSLEHRIANASVTLYRGEAGVLPLRPAAGSEVLLVALARGKAPRHYPAFVKEMKRRYRLVSTVEAGGGLDDGAAERIARQAGRAAAVVIASDLRGPSRDSAQGRLLLRLLDSNRPVVLLSLTDPYQAGVYPEAGTVVLTYGATRASLAAAARLLRGEILPRGKAPIRIPAGTRLPAGER